MLPADSARAIPISSIHSASMVPSYVKRLIQFPQMDLEFALYQMVWLCKSPKAVYKLTRHRKDTKNQWARDDPAFVAVLCWFLGVSSVVFGIAFKTSSFTAYLRLIAYSMLQFLAGGCIIASILWYVCNHHLKAPVLQHNVDQDVEWMYAFDVHCNAFVPCFILTHVLQFALLPVLVSDSFVAILLSNTLYLASWLGYSYITVLGYMTLPFLHKTNMLFMPVFGLAVVYLLAVILGYSMTHISLGYGTMIRWFLSTFFLALHWIRMALRLRSRIIGAIKNAVLSVVWDRCVQLGLQLVLLLQPLINTVFRVVGRQPPDLSTWTRYESYLSFRHEVRAAKLRLSVLTSVVTKAVHAATGREKASYLRHQRNLSSHCLRSDSQEVQAASQRDIDLTQFRKVLKFDPETATVKAESGVTMRQLCTHTLSRGFIPAVVPSCGSVTVGGAIAGIATGSTSFSHGFFHDCVVSMTVVTPDGKLVIASATNEHSGLFHALPGSCGTLGFIISATIRVIPALPCVELRRYHFPNAFSLFEEVGQAAGVTLHPIARATSRSSLGGSGRISPSSTLDDTSVVSSTASSDFMEAVIDTSRGLNVMITARFVEESGPVRRRNVGKWFGGLLSGAIKQHSLVMPTLDYFFRWDNTELRPSSVGMSALSAALGAVDASFFAIRCLSEAQRVLDHHNLLGDAPIQGSHNDVRENNQPEDDEKDMQRNGKADDDVSSIGPSASMAGSPNRIASRLRKAGSSVAAVLVKFRESVGLLRQDVVPFHRCEDLVHSFCSELPQCAMILTPCKGSLTWPAIVDRKGTPVLLMAITTSVPVLPNDDVIMFMDQNVAALGGGFSFPTTMAYQPPHPPAGYNDVKAKYDTHHCMPQLQAKFQSCP